LDSLFYDQKIVALNLLNIKRDSYNLGINSQKIEFWIYGTRWSGVTEPVSEKRYIGGVDLKINQWYFIAGSYDGDTIRTFVNAALDRKNGDDVRNISITYDTGKSLYIGYSPSVQEKGHFFKGKIDDLRVYNRALSESEIDSLYRMK